MTHDQTPRPTPQYQTLLKTHRAELALVLVAIGSLGPWATYGRYSDGGVGSDGVITLAIAIAAAIVLNVPVGAARSRAWAAICLGLLMVAASGYDTGHIQSVLGPLGGGDGWGVIVALIGSLAFTVLAALRVWELRASANAPSA